MATQGSTQGPVQGPEPEWKALINQLANLNGKQSDISQVAAKAAATIEKQHEILNKVADNLKNILEKIRSTPSSEEIKSALEQANTTQVSAVENLINQQTDKLTPELDTLQRSINEINDITSEINRVQNPQTQSSASVGGKRRRRTRNKKRKYHKKTKRGGYRYKKEKNKDN